MGYTGKMLISGEQQSEEVEFGSAQVKLIHLEASQKKKIDRCIWMLCFGDYTIVMNQQMWW